MHIDLHMKKNLRKLVWKILAWLKNNIESCKFVAPNEESAKRFIVHYICFYCSVSLTVLVIFFLCGICTTRENSDHPAESIAFFASVVRHKFEWRILCDFYSSWRNEHLCKLCQVDIWWQVQTLKTRQPERKAFFLSRRTLFELFSYSLLWGLSVPFNACTASWMSVFLFKKFII